MHLHQVSTSVLTRLQEIPGKLKKSPFTLTGSGVLIWIVIVPVIVWTCSGWIHEKHDERSDLFLPSRAQWLIKWDTKLKHRYVLLVMPDTKKDEFMELLRRRYWQLRFIYSFLWNRTKSKTPQKQLDAQWRCGLVKIFFLKEKSHKCSLATETSTLNKTLWRENANEQFQRQDYQEHQSVFKNKSVSHVCQQKIEYNNILNPSSSFY